MGAECASEPLTVLNRLGRQVAHPRDILAKGTRRGAFGRRILLVGPSYFLDLVNERRGAGSVTNAKAGHSKRLRQGARDQYAVMLGRLAHSATVGELAVRLVDNHD